MLLLPLLGLTALLYQAPMQQGGFQGATTPPSGDTTGYWQQRVHYTVTATLDETQNKLRSEGVLVYTNNSPDTLREMFFHQYLNAFRPGSKWSAVDARENRERFQNLREPDIGYERLTMSPVVDGTPVIIDYPGAPDSTVMHFRLPRPLAPHDSITIRLAWDARPSTVTRRQGRRGRTWDFAQWYPKVAVYDRGGWEPNPLVPAGELYGEFGTYDVTMVVREWRSRVGAGVTQRAAVPRGERLSRCACGAQRAGPGGVPRGALRGERRPSFRLDRVARLQVRRRDVRAQRATHALSDLGHGGGPRAVQAGRRFDVGRRPRGRAHDLRRQMARVDLGTVRVSTDL
jgi:hypothetical protein